MKSHHEYRSKNFARPFRSNTPIHVVFRSPVAKGNLSMAARHHRQWLNEYLPALCRKLRVELMHWSNNGNHLHCLVRAADLASFQSFLRALPGRVARQVLRAEKSLGKSIRFWTRRPYSRIISWGRELRSVMNYIERNLWEATGKIRYQPRESPVPTDLTAALSKSVKGRKREGNPQLSLF